MQFCNIRYHTRLTDDMLCIVGIGFAVLVVGYVRVTMWMVTSYRQSHKIRRALLEAALRQEIGWFDTNDAGELSTRLSE